MGQNKKSYNDLNMPVITANGITINYLEQGQGFPLVLLHGLSDDLNLWAPLIPLLAERYRVIAPDVRGHGRSGKPGPPYSIKLFSQDLAALLDGLAVSTAHLMGLSMGAAIAQQFALDHVERTGSLVLLSAFDHCDAHLKKKLLLLRNSLSRGGMAAFFDEAVKLVVTPDFIDDNSAAMADARKYCVQMNSVPALVNAIDACLSFDVRRRMPQLKAAALILSGKEDVFTPPSMGRELQRRIKRSKWALMEGTGHNLILPDNIMPINEAVMGFLNNFLTV